jgi:hypothetical protein
VNNKQRTEEKLTQKTTIQTYIFGRGSCIEQDVLVVTGVDLRFSGKPVGQIEQEIYKAIVRYISGQNQLKNNHLATSI